MREKCSDVRNPGKDKSGCEQGANLQANMIVHDEPHVGLKRFNITVLVGTYETHSVWIPEGTTLADAIKWANENQDQIPHNGDELVSVDDDNCNFED